MKQAQSNCLERRRYKEKGENKEGEPIDRVEAVMFCPVTPKGELKKELQKVENRFGQIQGIKRIRIEERAGTKISEMLRNKQAWNKVKCEKERCWPCETAEKESELGKCSKESVTYKIKCVGENCQKNKYRGETAANRYTRGKKHLSDLASRNTSNLPLWRHCVEEHGGELQTFQTAITGSFRNDSTDTVQIENTPTGSLMNDRAEWNMTRVPRVTIST